MDIQNALLQAQKERRENILKGFTNQEELVEDSFQKSEQLDEFNPFDEFEKAEQEDETEGEEFEKGGKPATAGEIRTWGGKNYKKQANGKWLEVSEHGMTKREHDHQYNQALMTYQNLGSDRHQKIASEHAKASSKLSDKEYSDKESGIKEHKKEDSKQVIDKISDLAKKFVQGGKNDASLYNNAKSLMQDYCKSNDLIDATNKGYYSLIYYKDRAKELEKKGVSDEKIKKSLEFFKKVSQGSDGLFDIYHKGLKLVADYKSGKEINHKDYWPKEEKERYKNNSNDIQKGEISDSVNYGDSIKVKKKGSEIKEQINNVILPELNSKLLKLEESADEILVDCGKAPTMPSSNFYYGSLGVEVPFKVYNWDESQYCDKSNGITTSLSSEDAMMKASKLNYPANKEQAENRQKYNQIIRDMISVTADIKTCEVLKSLKDNDEFSLTTRQVVSFKF